MIKKKKCAPPKGETHRKDYRLIIPQKEEEGND